VNRIRTGRTSGREMPSQCRGRRKLVGATAFTVATLLGPAPAQGHTPVDFSWNWTCHQGEGAAQAPGDCYLHKTTCQIAGTTSAQHRRMDSRTRSALLATRALLFGMRPTATHLTLSTTRAGSP